MEKFTLKINNYKIKLLLILFLMKIFQFNIKLKNNFGFFTKMKKIFYQNKIKTIIFLI